MTVLKTLENPALPGKMITLERGELRDFSEVRWIFDTFSSGVYGFVPDGRIRRHLEDGQVHLVRIDGEIAALAIGKPGATLWNIIALPQYRHLHLGTLLIEVTKPEMIRVKCRPHPGMSEEDLSRFSDPTPFYERMGFVEAGWDYPKNFYLGKNSDTGRGIYVSRGSLRTVKLMRRLQPGEKAPEKDQTLGPRISRVRIPDRSPHVRAED